MTERKQNYLQRQKLLAIVLTVAMVFTGALGTIGAEKSYAATAKGDAICKVTVVVKDKSTGEVIEDANVIFTSYYKVDGVYQEYDNITRNEDGTYNVPYESDYGDSYYKYYAVANGYKDSRTLSNGVLTGNNITVGGESMTAGELELEPESTEEKIQSAITAAQTEINEYVDKADYDPAEQTQIETIIQKYMDKISENVNTKSEDANAQIEILNGIVEEAKAELDTVVTSQSNVNEEYADDVYFETVNGRILQLAREDYGKYTIELSRYNNGGTFKIEGNDADTSVTWVAKQEMFSIYAGGQNVPFEIIDNTYDKGVFLNSKAFPDDVDYKANVKSIEDCSVSYTKDGKTVKVTFDLIIKDKSVEELENELDAALAKKEDAEQQLTEAENAKGQAEADLEQAEADLEDAKAAIEDLQNELKETQAMKNHVLVKVAAKAATCTSEGNHEYYICATEGHEEEVYSDTNLTPTTIEDQTIPKTEHSFKEVVTKATPSSNGKIEEKCSECGEVESTTTIYKPATFTLSATAYTYDGNVKKPTVTVKDSAGKTLVKDTDYTLTYASGRKNVGKYSVKITLKGKYSGSKTLYFKINPPKTSLASLTSASKSFTAKWKKKTTQVTGYQIQYSTSSKFTNAKTVTIKNNKTVSKKISNLTAKKKYYVKVRTYKTVGTAKYYSSWSGYKTVKTK